MIYEIQIETKMRDEIIDITNKVQQVVEKSGVSEGVANIFVPHTTAAITVNENADPDVKSDFLMELDKIVPHDDGYRHMEGNSAAHLKASLTGFSERVFIEEGRLFLGIWQGIWFCEYDGPRMRKVYIKVTEQ